MPECEHVFSRTYYRTESGGSAAYVKCCLPVEDSVSDAKPSQFCYFHSKREYKNVCELKRWREKLRGTKFEMKEEDNPSYPAWEAYLINAELDKVHLESSLLWNSNLVGANLRGAYLHKCELPGVKYEFFPVSLLWCPNQRLTNVVNVANHEINWSHNPRMKRDVENFQWLAQFQEEHRFRYQLWKYFAFFGRSFVLVGFWAIVFILLFAFVYWCFDLVKHSGDGTTHGFDWIYFSVVTFTTLGYGDFVPVGFVGQLIVCSEVLVAYVMLGLLVAVAAARFARLN